MKLTYEDKLEIYRLLKEEGVGCKRLAKKFSITYSNARYIFHLIDLYGPEIVRHGKNRKYSKGFKEAAIKRALAGEESIVSISLNLGLSNLGTLFTWIKSCKENDYTVVERKRGRHDQKESEDDRGIRNRNQSLEERELEANHRERIHKKLSPLVARKEKTQKKKSQ